MIVIADTSPVNYLILIGHIDLLAQLYGKIVLPTEVVDELLRTGAAEPVRRWASELPAWVELRDPPAITLGLPEADLDPGELAALQLAVGELEALVLVDDAAGRRAAASLRIGTIGTVGILIRAAELGWIDLPAAVSRLRETSFYMSQYLLSAVERSLKGNNQD